MILLAACHSQDSDLRQGKANNSQSKFFFIALREAKRYGWRNVMTEREVYRDGYWWVHVYRRPLRVANADAFVKIAPDGTVVSFEVNRE